MEICDNIDNPLLQRIRRCLAPLLLSEEDEGMATLGILKHARFLDDDKTSGSEGGQLGPDSTFFDFPQKIKAVVERFAADGLTRESYLQAALKQPQLFVQKPETITANIDRVVERFAADGLTRKNYLQAALRHPQIFYQKPETIILHLERIFRLFDDGVIALPTQRRHKTEHNDRDSPTHHALLSVLLTHPSLITLDVTNYELRDLHQRMKGTGPTWRNLTHSRRHIEDELRSHLSHPDSDVPVPPSDYIVGDGTPTEEQARRFVLRALMREGFIKGGTFGLS